MELSDIEVMQTPEEWPHRVVLPLKRYSKTPGSSPTRPDAGFSLRIYSVSPWERRRLSW